MIFKKKIEFYNTDYLKEYLKITPLSLALIRAIECDVISKTDLYRPILDMGCGDGKFASILFKSHIDLGLDNSKKEINECRKRKKYKSLILADAGHIPIKDNYFSTVFSNSVFEHLDNLENGLREIHRVLKKDGILIFTTHTNLYRKFLSLPLVFGKWKMDGISFLYFQFLNYLWRHTNNFPKRKWIGLLKKNGFEVIENRYYMARKTTRIFNLLLPLAIPSFFIKKITGRWIAFLPFHIRKMLANRIYKYYYMEKNNQDNPYGACILFKAKKITRK